MTVSEDEALQLVVSLHRLVRSLARASGPARLHPTALIVMANLYDKGPSRIGEIAERVFVSQPTATSAVAALEADGLVRREPDPTDGRAIQVAITDNGIATVRAFARKEAEVLAHRLASLPEDERVAVVAASAPLRKLAEPTEAPAKL